MWRERCLIQIVGIKGDNSHLLGAGVGKDGNIRPRTQPRIIHSCGIEPLASQGGEYLAWHIFVQQKGSWTSYHSSLTSSPHFPAHRQTL